MPLKSSTMLFSIMLQIMFECMYFRMYYARNNMGTRMKKDGKRVLHWTINISRAVLPFNFPVESQENGRTNLRRKTCPSAGSNYTVYNMPDIS